MSHRAWIAVLALAACTPTVSIGSGGFADVVTADVPATGDTPATTDAPGADVPVTDAPGADVPAATDAPRADATGPTIAWGERCNGAADSCAAPAGETGRCSLVRGTPLCFHTCNGQPEFSMCEGGRGVCISSGDGQRFCLPKCGDAERVACAPGAACAWLGYRDRRDVNAGLVGIGVCLGNCTSGGPDACMGAGRACNATTRTCEAADCEGMCPMGTTCSAGSCNPPTPAAIYTACNPARGAPVVCAQNYCLGGATTGSGFCTQACDSESGSLSCGTGACYYGLNVSATPGDAAVVGYWESAVNTLGGRLGGVCLKACATAADCPTQFTCQNYNGARVCVPYSITEGTTMPGAGVAGSLCRANSDCATNNCVLVPGYRDGVCGRVSATAPCPAGTAVLNGATGPTLACVRTCSRDRDNDCPGSWRCNTTGACDVLGCRANSDCTGGFTCDVASNRCLPAPLPGAGTVGAPCAGGSACASDFCFTPTVGDGGVTQWAGGYCSVPCTGLPGGGDTCPAGSFCSVHNVGALGACLKLCDARPGVNRFGGCRGGYACQPFQGDPRFGVCLNP